MAVTFLTNEDKTILDEQINSLSENITNLTPVKKILLNEDDNGTITCDLDAVSIINLMTIAAIIVFERCCYNDATDETMYWYTSSYGIQALYGANGPVVEKYRLRFPGDLKDIILDGINNTITIAED